VPELGSTQPIIIKKKIVAGGGHHGGAWKVAYADFVTAMMALFIVLWLMNASPEVQQAVGGYFRDPSGKAGQTGGGQAAAGGEGLSVKKDDFEGLKSQIEQAMRSLPALAALKDQVAMTVTGEGLRIELLEAEHNTFFESGRGDPNIKGVDVLELLAAQLGELPNHVLIEGHTDAKPFAGRAGYSNWELSTDRANAARRLMLEHGLWDGQVKQIRGYADQHLRRADAPEDSSNRRISVLVQYGEAPAGKSAEPPAGKRGGAAAGAHDEPTPAGKSK
jgi:chemotaxis protein MotB